LKQNWVFVSKVLAGPNLYPTENTYSTPQNSQHRRLEMGDTSLPAPIAHLEAS